MLAAALLGGALLAGVSCKCNDSPLMSGVGKTSRACGMSCVDRDGRACDCSGLCPCWRIGEGGKRRHLKAGERP